MFRTSVNVNMWTLVIKLNPVGFLSLSVNIKTLPNNTHIQTKELSNSAIRELMLD